MPTKELLTINIKPIDEAEAAYETKRKELLKKYPSNVPDELILPSEYIHNPPRNVTGIPRECGLLTPKELEITEQHDTVSLAEAIASRKLTAVEVATAFSKRAIIAHQVTNCLSEWFMDEAIQRARELDDHLQKTGKTVGPLHGVPISVKEMVPLKGKLVSMAMVVTMKDAENDCLLIEILRSLGAVFYCKTKQPQALLAIESSSALGRVVNPHNINLAPGGSSGGEAALIGMRGSIMGVGTDLGGSLRVPAAFCGIYSFKGTSGNLPVRDMISVPFPAGLNLDGIIGPMGTSLRGLDFFVRAVLSTKPYLRDPSVVPIPWTGLNTPIANKPLKVGIISSDGIVQPHPPLARAIKWAQSRINASTTATATNFTIPDSAYAYDLVCPMFFPDGGLGIRGALAAAGEPLLVLMERVLKWVDEPRENPSKPQGELGVNAAAEYRLKRDLYRNRMADAWASEENGEPDVIICPTYAGVAPEHDTGVYVGYTALWNLVDYPAVIIPTPFKVETGGERFASDVGEPANEHDKLYRTLWGEDGKQFEGAPIALQVVARRNHDNELFGALNVLRDVLELR